MHNNNLYVIHITMFLFKVRFRNKHTNLFKVMCLNNIIFPNGIRVSYISKKFNFI